MAKIDDRLLDVNQYGVLKIPLELWLALLFLMRQWVVLLFTMGSALTSQTAGLQTLASKSSAFFLLAELPAALAFLLCARRMPEAGRLVRWLWPHTRALITTTVVLHGVYVAFYLTNSDYWLPWPELFLASCLLVDLIVLYSLYTSNHLKSVLLEFPSPLERTTTQR